MEFHLPGLQISCNTRLLLQHLPEVQLNCGVSQVEYFRLYQIFPHTPSSVVANFSDFELVFFSLDSLWCPVIFYMARKIISSVDAYGNNVMKLITFVCKGDANVC